MTKRIHILVEGQTEETFVKEVLSGHLWEFDVFPNVTMVCTKIVKNVRTNRGGGSSYSKIKRDLTRLCQDSDAAAITTMFDFYALPPDFPGLHTIPQRDCYKQVKHLEHEFRQDIGDSRFIPFIMLHEFETILFCDPSKLTYSFPGKSREIQEVQRISDTYDSPELINNSPETAPSKRILHFFPEYIKPLHGCTTALEIGLEQIRRKCGHFHQWLSALENV